MLHHKLLDSQNNNSQITISFNGVNTNIMQSQEQNIIDLLNELRKIGKKYVPKGSQLSKFEQIISKISELQSSQMRKSSSQRSKNLLLSQMQGLQLTNKKSKYEYQSKSGLPQIAQTKQKPFQRTRQKSQKRVVLSPHKQSCVENQQQYILSTQLSKSGGKYQKFKPALVAKSPKKSNL